MTYQMTVGTLRFTVDVPRYRWELGYVDGDECLIPREQIVGARFRGSPALFALLSEPAELDQERLLAFVNNHSGLLVDESPPVPEPLWKWQAESYVFSRLLDLHGMRLAGLEHQRWSGRPLGAPARRSDPVADWISTTPARLLHQIPELRPQCGAGVELTALAEPDAVVIAWINATAAEHWAVQIPLFQWVGSPISDRAANLAPLLPAIRCRTLLGYAYAALLVKLEKQNQILQLSRQGRLPGVDEFRGPCQLCGKDLELLHPTGRKRRSDVLWCRDCRTVQNTAAQRKHRTKAPSPPAS